MNKHYHAYSEANSLEHDIQNYNAKELETLYGIQFIDLDKSNPKKGRVYDAVSGKEYKSLQEWVADQIEEDKWSDSEHLQTSHKYDEDF